MIEVIYDHSEESEPTGEIQGIRLPKNIRQVGAPQGSRKIYVEDYVMTYLNQLAKPGNTYARGAILLGEYKQSEGQGVLFISGALEAQNVEFDMEETEFSNEIWSKIYSDVKNFFPELEVVGWFLSRMGFSTQVNEKITKMHVENFPGRDKVLYMIDSLEEEDAWYFYENSELKKQSGYYIYYTRNDAMQNYMMTQRNHMVESETDIAERDQDLLNAYRRRLEQRKAVMPEKERKSAGFFYVASSLLTVACLALGISAISNYDRLKHLETAFQRIAVMTDGGGMASDSGMTGSKGTSGGKGTSEDIPVVNVISVDANVTPVGDSSQDGEANSETSTNSESVSDGQHAESDPAGNDAAGEGDGGTQSSNEDSRETLSTDSVSSNTNSGKASTESATNSSSQDSSDGTEPSSETSAHGNDVPTGADAAEKYYTVKDGDTLSSISFSMYHTILYVDNIMEANNLKNGDDIYAGQTLVIPEIP